MSLKYSFSRLAGLSGLAISFAVAPALLHSQTPTTAPVDPSHKVDNSAQNDVQQKTADQQLNNKSDIQITQQIRKAIIADHSLSMYAHNIKIITRNGAVTLKGPVHTLQEQQAIMTAAEGVVGAGKVMNKITVKGAAKPAAQ